jgi:putative effector of murein hydrolase
MKSEKAGFVFAECFFEWDPISELSGKMDVTDRYLDDYVTRGVTLGGNSSAIATAVLLVSDPRAAALSSLSMSLFGIITLALTSVPVIVKAIDSLVDL